MKSLLLVLALAGVLAGITLLGVAVQTNTGPAQPSTDLQMPEPMMVQAGGLPSMAAEPQTERFKPSFPIEAPQRSVIPVPPSPVASGDDPVKPRRVGVLQVDQIVSVDLAVGESLQRYLRPAALEDQLRDALLVAVVAASGLNAADQEHALRDTPANRLDGTRTDDAVQTGPLRWCPLRGDRVLFLTPKSEQARRKIDLAQVADSYRWKYRKRPSEVLPVEYELRVEKSLATVSALPAIKGQELFSDAFGYSEQLIKGDEDELKTFLSRIDDLVWIQPSQEGGRHVFGGRRLPGRQACGLLPAQAVLVWHVDQRIARLAQDHERRWRELKTGCNRSSVISCEDSAAARLSHS